ncbi:MAG: exodeoxyribonuclease VII small subunit [Pseudomonadota bacterium]
MESQTYGKMLEDVEDIVKGLSSGNIDLDRMVFEVERGYELIKVMRERLQTTRMKLEDLRKDLDLKQD